MTEAQESSTGTIRDGGVLRIEAKEVFDISVASELHREFRQAIEDSLSVEIDASMIRRIDASALQLLTALVQDVQARDRQVSWVEPTQEFIYSAELLGLSLLLELPEAVTA